MSLSAGLTLSAGLKWVEGLHFAAQTPDGQHLHLDSQHGLLPKELLLYTLSGCTGMDVAAILHKMRAEFSTLEVSAQGSVADEHPRVFRTIEVLYRMQGPPEVKDKFLRAVELSWTRYCAVTHMLKQAAAMRYQVELNGEVIHTGT